MPLKFLKQSRREDSLHDAKKKSSESDRRCFTAPIISRPRMRRGGRAASRAKPGNAVSAASLCEMCTRGATCRKKQSSPRVDKSETNNTCSLLKSSLLIWKWKKKIASNCSRLRHKNVGKIEFVFPIGSPRPAGDMVSNSQSSRTANWTGFVFRCLGLTDNSMWFEVASSLNTSVNITSACK